MDLSGKFSAKIRAAIKSKLTELGAYVDDELPDYIMVMVANRKGKDHMAKDLALFLGHNTSLFIDWLHSALVRLEAGGDVSAASGSGDSAKESRVAASAAAPPPDSTATTPAASASSKQAAPSVVPATVLSGSQAPQPPPPQAQPQQPVPTPAATVPAGGSVANAGNDVDAGRRRRPRSPTPTERRGGDRDRRRSPAATAGATALRRQSSSDGRREERERLRSDRRGGGGGGGGGGRRSRSRSRSRSPRSRSRSRNRQAGSGDQATAARNRPAVLLKTKNMLMKAMSEAERSVKAPKRDPSETAAAASAPTVVSSGQEEATPLTFGAAASAPDGRAANGGLSERIRDRLGEQRPRSRSRSRSASHSRSPRDRRRRHRRQRRRHHHGSRSRSRSRSGGRRRRSRSRQRRSSRSGGDAGPSIAATRSAKKRADEELKSPPAETKKILLVSEAATATAAAVAAAAPPQAPVAIATAPAAQTINAAPQVAAAPSANAVAVSAAAGAAEPQFVVTLTGAGDRYRLLADRLGRRQSGIDDDDEDMLPGYGAGDLEQLAEEIIEFEELEEVPLPHSYNLLIGDSDTEDEQSPTKRAAAAAAAAATVNRPPGGQQQQQQVLPANQSKPRERCRYWPACKSGQACPYWHPVEPCKAFPNCKFGNACLFVHPPCRFQAMCTNPVCPYAHSTGAAAAATAAVAQLAVAAPSAPIVQPAGMQAARSTGTVKCRFFPNCTNMSCPFYHPTSMCRYGLACANQQTCLFNHPSLPSRSKLVWTKTATGQGPQHAEAAAAADSAADPPASNVIADGVKAKRSSPAGHGGVGEAKQPVGGGGVIKLR